MVDEHAARRCLTDKSSRASGGGCQGRVFLARLMLEGPAGAVRVTPTELRVLFVLAANAGRSVSKADIGAVVWDRHVTQNCVEVYVGYVRAKLVKVGVVRGLRTIRGIGYRLERGALSWAE